MDMTAKSSSHSFPPDANQMVGECHTYFPQSPCAYPRIPCGSRALDNPYRDDLIYQSLVGVTTMNSNLIAFPPIRDNCTTCRWSRACIARALDPRGLAELARYVTHGGPIRHGEQLYRQGDKLEALYVLRAGSIKVYLDSEDGCEQALAFLYPGDMFGFDAIANNRHPTSAVALETAAYCAIPYERVMALGAKMPSVSHEVMRAAATGVMAAHHHVMLLGQKSAPARFAMFLLDLSARLAARGCSKTEFNLSMSRQDIANYLAVAVETISRLFTDLDHRGVIAVDRRLVKILSLPALEAVARDAVPLRVGSA